jgi:predicted MFS family arabinose efflux permease
MPRRAAHALADALATPDLRRLQLAWACAAVGGWMFMIALAVHAYDAGGATAVGLAALVRMLPAGLAAPLLGFAGDRFSRRDVLLATTLARALVLGAAALALDDFALLLALAAVFTVLTAAHKPAQAALLPKLAPRAERQAAANAVWSAVDNASFVAGALAAGAIVTAAGTGAAFAAAATTFAVAASLLARIASDAPARRRAPGPRADLAGHRDGEGQGGAREGRRDDREVSDADRDVPHAGARAGFSSAAREASAGLRVVARDPRLRLLVGVLSASTLIEGMVDVLVVVTALRVVDLGGQGVGWLNAAWGVGGIVGGGAALAFTGRGRLAATLPAGGLLIGLPLVALAALPSPEAALLLLAALGVGYALVEVAGLTLLQRLAADAVRARAFAVVESSYWLTTGAGAMLAPPLIALAGPRAALALVGAALPLIVLARLAALRRLAAQPPLWSVPAPAAARAEFRAAA